MDAGELEKYKYQLDQVESALRKDPSNSELQNLKEELESLITLTSSILSEQKPQEPKQQSSNKVAKGPSKPVSSGETTSAASTPTPQPQQQSQQQHKKTYAIGEECRARYSGDRRFYNATILSIGGPGSTQENPMYTVRYVDYGTTGLVSASDLRSMNENNNKKRPAPAASDPDAEREKARRIARAQKKEEKRQAKEGQQSDKRNAWASFAKKGSKKGLKGISNDSMFKTPDNPYGKVGVVGSGKGMTTVPGMGKHQFESSNSKGA